MFRPKLPQKGSLKKKSRKDSLRPGSVVNKTNKSLIFLLDSSDAIYTIPKSAPFFGGIPTIPKWEYAYALQ